MDQQLPEALFLVQSLSWDFVDWEARPRFRDPDDQRGELVSSFRDRDQAEQCCAALERERQAEVNPFEYCETIDELTYFDADRWHDWILDAGLEPPAAGPQRIRDHWYDWWVAQAPTMTELQRAKMWQAMEKLRFYCIVELHAAAGWLVKCQRISTVPLP